MQNEYSLLETMLKDQKGKPKKFLPGPYWDHQCKIISHEIAKNGLDNFRNNPVLIQGYGDDANIVDPSILWTTGFRKLKRLFVNLKIIRRLFIKQYIDYSQSYLNGLKKYQKYYYESEFGDWFNDIIEDHYSLPNTLAGGHDQCLCYGGHKISLNYFIILRRIYNYSKVINFHDIERVFEIGGGFGSNAHLLLHLFPNIKKYLYLDIPPMLYVGTQYLKHFYGPGVVDYSKTRSLSKVEFVDDNSRQIIAISPWQLDKVEFNYDLFWNACSFQEMELEALKYYSEHLIRMSHDRSVLSFMMYQNVDSLTRSEKDILSFFENSFNIVELDQLVEDDKSVEIPPKYYFGQRKC